MDGYLGPSLGLNDLPRCRTWAMCEQACLNDPACLGISRLTSPSNPYTDPICAHAVILHYDSLVSHGSYTYIPVSARTCSNGKLTALKSTFSYYL